jgi:DNA ligase-associated metallophosphoesterase
MRTLSPSQFYVAEDVLLDGRLALFHEKERWLALADLHFGFELSQRAAGNLFPFWGMQTLEQRLLDLLDEYEPARLILLGDLVHDNAGAHELVRLIDSLRARCEVISIAGNHDRKMRRVDVDLVESWPSGTGFLFHHGDRPNESRECIQIIGHHHPAGLVRDGAGLRLKLPAFVQKKNCWIMPAFSPWAGGAVWPNDDEETRVWLCSPERILEI